MHFLDDDDSVVVMEVDAYLAGPEEMRRKELVWGVVREPPAPKFGHQTVVGRVFALLDGHVREHRLGIVGISPTDVVLDREHALVVQPDVLFVSNRRIDIVRDEIWGAPDLVVEVTSRATARYDRTTKLGWYRTYGVRECWLLDPAARVVTIVSCEDASAESLRRFEPDEQLESRVLPAFAPHAREFFA